MVGLPWPVSVRAAVRHGMNLAALAEVVTAGPGDDIVLVDRSGPMSRRDLVTAVAGSPTPSGPLVTVEGHHDRSSVVALLAAGMHGRDVAVVHPGVENAVQAGISGRAGIGAPRGRVWLGTTGTTGTPRQSARPRYGPGLIRPVAHLWRRWLRGRQGPVLVLPGLDHGYGLGFTLASLLLGRTVLLPPRGEPAALAGIVADWSPVVAVAVPPQLLWLTELQQWSPEVVVTGSSPLSAEVQQTATTRFGPVLHNLYGSTEAGFATMADPADLARRPGCVGRALPGIGVRVVDGRVVVHSPFATHRGRWVPTGDHGHWEDDLLVLDGRVDRVAVVNGVNVDLTEVHAALTAHPAVESVTVTADPDPVAGERVRADVRISEPVTAEALQEWVHRTVGPRVSVAMSLHQRDS
ncbi:MAG TPA: AMP-binding protein [Candidatus Avipropionibacterium avicola]|uniref:AMP-binding protein n=1 Tax=Candidatus Avipropionibacterium avicola TaxID=2840701 RepID=A0A9D1GWH2_9ACTN|nr:AMP-binding protein [Candidatus Avipropionibacterium avicola]